MATSADRNAAWRKRAVALLMAHGSGPQRTLEGCTNAQLDAMLRGLSKQERIAAEVRLDLAHMNPPRGLKAVPPPPPVRLDHG